MKKQALKLTTWVITGLLVLETILTPMTAYADEVSGNQVEIATEELGNETVSGDETTLPGDYEEDVPQAEGEIPSTEVSEEVETVSENEPVNVSDNDIVIEDALELESNQVSDIEITEQEPIEPVGGTSRTLNSISIATAPTKTSYYVGETFNPAGMVVKANYKETAPNTSSLWVKAGHVDVSIETSNSYSSSYIQPNSARAIYGNGTFIYVIDDNSFYSTNGSTWTKMSGVPSGARIFSVVYGGGKFICTGEDGLMLSSTNGTSWTTSTSPSTSDIYDITYGNGMFVCLTGSGSYYSTNGTSWTKMTKYLTSDCPGTVAYGNGRFVCVSKAYSYYSTDGKAWSSKKLFDSSEDYTFEEIDIIYGNGKFICIGDRKPVVFSVGTGDKYAYIYSSSDGVTWSSISSVGLASNTQYSIISHFGNGCLSYGNNVYVLASPLGLCKSTDAVTWAAMNRDDTTRAYGSAVAYGGGNFACIDIARRKNGGDYVLASSDAYYLPENITTNTSSTITSYTTSPTSLVASTKEVVISYSDGGVTKTVKQPVTVAEITETSRALKSIRVKTAPTKTSYYVGDTFDKTGMVVEAVYNVSYSNGTSDDVSAPITSYSVPSTPLEKTDTYVTISFTDGTTKTVQQPITVAEVEETSRVLQSVSISTAPAKTTYYAGDTFDKTGMVVKATYLVQYNNGTSKTVTETITNYTVPTSELAEGIEMVTVTYTYGSVTKTAKQSVTVLANDVESKALVSISVNRAPNKTEYIAGDSFDADGMTVNANYKVTYKNGDVINKTEPISNFDCTDRKLLATDTYVTISYSDGLVTKTVRQPITVTAATEVSRELKSIAVTTAPTKTAYYVGDIFDKAGMVVKATYEVQYNNGTSDDVVEESVGYTVTTTPLTAVDTFVAISLTYQDVTKSTQQPITVTGLAESSRKLVSINVNKAPTKTVYNFGETFDATGMEIYANFRVKYNNGSEKDVSEAVTTYDVPTSALVHQSNVVVSYTHGSDTPVTKTTQVPIKVNAIVTDFESRLLHEVYEYKQLAKSDVEVVAIFSDNSRKVMSANDYIIEPTGILAGENTVEITCKGIKKPFTFTASRNRSDISNATIKLSKSVVTYNGLPQRPSVTVKDGKKKLSVNTHYTVTYKDNIQPGTASVIITGNHAYSFSRTVTFSITKNDSKPFSKNKKYSIKNASVTYPGKAYMKNGQVVNNLNPVVKLKGVVLTEGVDYNVEYVYKTDTKKPKATIYIVGTENSRYVTAGSKKTTYKYIEKEIKKVDAKKLSVSKIGKIYYDNGYDVESLTFVVKSGSRILKKGIDYSVEYQNNKNVTTKKSKAKIIITGLEGSEYVNAGTIKTVSFTIYKAPLTSKLATKTNLELTPNMSDATLTVYYNGLLLKEGVDYKCTLKRSKGIVKSAAVKGMGNYTGSITIKPAPFPSKISYPHKAY